MSRWVDRIVTAGCLAIALVGCSAGGSSTPAEQDAVGDGMVDADLYDADDADMDDADPGDADLYDADDADDALTADADADDADLHDADDAVTADASDTPIPGCPPGLPCEDGDPCTVGDACADGACAAGLPVQCTATDACAVAYCDPLTGGCKQAAALDDTLCDDGSVCTSLDRCAAGVCGGLPVDCDDGNACTADTCDPQAGCAHAPAAGPCEDGQPCTTSDSCVDGACTAGVVDCPDATACAVGACGSDGSCATTPAPDGAPCPSSTPDLQASCLGGLCTAALASSTVFVPAGVFVMGSPSTEVCRQDDEAQHTVTLTQDIVVARGEVSQAQWQARMGNNPSKHADCPTCPVDSVSWFEALAWCNAASVAAGLPPCYALQGCSGTPGGSAPYTCQSVAVTAPGNNVYACTGYRLPTEAEWERVARAGTTGATYNGDVTMCAGADPVLEPIAWYQANAGGGSHPGGQKQPNAWGVYDAIGNVYEWCWDYYTSFASKLDVTDPAGPSTPPSSEINRITRGGGYVMFPFGNRAAWREGFGEAHRDGFIGFRWVRTVGP